MGKVKKKAPVWVQILVFIAFVSGFSWVGVTSYQNTQHFLSKGVLETATVLHVEEVRKKRHKANSKGHVVVKISYPFEGRVVTVSKRYSGTAHIGRFKRGDQLEIIYDPEDPDSFVANDFFDLWLWPMISLGVVIFVLLIGAYSIRASSKHV